MGKKYQVITLCGSARFHKEMKEAARKLSLEGNVVLSPVFFEKGSLSAGNIDLLENLQRQRIDMADLVMVINKDGYIGNSTRAEIAYAYSIRKEIVYSETPERFLCPVCGRYYFTEPYDICPVCGWEDDKTQLKDPDMEGGANDFSLNQARAMFENRSF